MSEEVIQEFLVNNSFFVRPTATNGFWVFFLLPISIIVSALSRSLILTPTYRLITLVSISLVASSIHIIIKCFKKERLKLFSVWTIAIALCTGSLVNIYLHKGWIFSIFTGLFVTLVYLKIYTFLLSTMEESFTLGEASLIAQGITLFSYSTLLNIVNLRQTNLRSNMQISTIIIQVGLVGIMTLAYIVNILNIKTPKLFYTTTCIVLTTIIVLPLHIILDQNPVLWIFGQVFGDVLLLKLFFYWTCCVAVAVLAVSNQIYYAQKASTGVRKIFHILAVLVYLPGLNFRCTFLYMASGVMLGVFFTLEILRLVNVAPLGNRLQEGYVIFKDEKDTGLLALTPIYLLVGVSLPIWIHPSPCDVSDSAQFDMLPLLSGLLSIGIGDTAASYVGSTFGRYKWKDSTKTIEGTLACVFSQLGCVYLLHFIGFFFHLTAQHITKIVISILVGSLVEAKTTQIDNLVLPLVTYVILII